MNSIAEVDEKRLSYNDISEGFLSEKVNDLSANLKEPLFEEEQGPEIRIITGAYKLGKVPEQCEDAYFVTDRGFGVADGVSGWNDYGFSSCLFSTGLMENCKSEIESYLSQQKESQQSKKIMNKMRKNGSFLSMENLDVEAAEHSSCSEDGSVDKGKSDPKLDNESITLHPIYILSQAFSKLQAVGSSTALVAIRNQREINIANLGDSGFVLIRFRNNEAYTAARSKEQQHSFNIPYQLSILPGPNELENLKKRGRIEELKKLRAILKRSETMMCQDKPDDADEYSFEL